MVFTFYDDESKGKENSALLREELDFDPNALSLGTWGVIFLSAFINWLFKQLTGLVK